MIGNICFIITKTDVSVKRTRTVPHREDRKRQKDKRFYRE